MRRMRIPFSASASRGDAAFDMLQHELLAEKASSLGRAGAEVERRMRRLAAASCDDREKALQDAADAVFAYVVQRDLCGFHAHDEPLELLGVTREVMTRVGARRR